MDGFKEGCRPSCGECGEPWSKDSITSYSNRIGSLTSSGTRIVCKKCGCVIYEDTHLYDTVLYAKFGIRALSVRQFVAAI